MDIKRELIEQRLAALKKERDEFLVAANREIAKYNGKVEALETLLKESVGEEHPEGELVPPVDDQAGDQEQV